MRVNGKAPHPRVVVRDVERSFGSGDEIVRVLRGVDLSAMPGERVALYGPSGSGKTTLLNLIGALDRPNQGTIRIDDVDILKLSDGKRARLRRKRIGFIFQSYTLVPTYTAYENVDLALRLPGLGFFERRKRTTAALAAVGLTAWADHVPDELSGGQRQRVAIARALALQPARILADEPTSGRDSRTARRSLALFGAVAAAQGTTFLIVSHVPMVANYVDVAYDLHDGRLMPHAIQKEPMP
ncbi:MAG: ABC transporter ATP-binding protein [Anaerolineae bacterium]|nr:ABC transporter ATP-binding protein [Anaerolineae bacterium]